MSTSALFSQDRVILSLCDYSGTWSDPYRQAGYTVIQIDIKHGKDVRLLKKLDAPIHGILAAPVCTEFSAAGARHWSAKEAAGNQGLIDGLGIVDACLRLVYVHRPKFWVMENPVGRLADYIGNHRLTFQPHEFAGYLTGAEAAAEQYTKRTCLWGEFNIPKKKELPPTLGSKMWSQYGGKSDKTKEMRSITPRGFARAFFEANP